eukprot:COSAG01_NODE_3799_length_5686_cov_6.512619_2_plen_646_part_00
MAVWVRIDEPPPTETGGVHVRADLHIAGSSYVNVSVELVSRKIRFILLDEVGRSHSAVGVASSLELRQWCHLTVTHTPHKQLAIYVDGAQIFSTSAPFTFQAGAGAFTLGGAWRGALTDLRVISRDLSALDVHTLAQTGKVSTIVRESTVAWWTFQLSDHNMRNGSYAASLWPSLASAAVAIALNSEVSHLSIDTVQPAAWYPGTTVPGPSRGDSSTWALKMDGHMVQATSNLLNGTLLEHLAHEQYDFVTLWDWSDIWGFPGCSAKTARALKALLMETRRVGLRVLAYVDVSGLSEQAPGFREIVTQVESNHSGKPHVSRQHGTNQSIYRVAVSSPAWAPYFTGHLQSFLEEFDLSGIYCDEAGLQAGINDVKGRANFGLSAARDLFAQIYEIVHEHGMVMMQNHGGPVVATNNYHTDMVLMGEAHYWLLQYRNLTHNEGRPLMERIQPAMAQAWWVPVAQNLPVVFDTKQPTDVLHFNGGSGCPSRDCGWERQQILTTRELETITAIHGMATWGPLDTNAYGTSWPWWQALGAVGCHGSASILTRATCQFHGYWTSKQSTDLSIMVSHFTILRVNAAQELLLLVANYGETSRAHTSVELLRGATAWTLKQAWPSGTTGGISGNSLVVDFIAQHALQYFHLVAS